MLNGITHNSGSHPAFSDTRHVTLNHPHLAHFNIVDGQRNSINLLGREYRAQIIVD